MEPVQYLRALRRRWVVVVLAVGVAVATAWVTTETVAPPAPAPRQYQATAVLWNVPGTSSPISLDAMVRIATLPDVVGLAAGELGWQGAPAALRGRVQVQVDPQGEAFLDITGVAPTRAESEAIAGAFSRALIRYLQTLQTQQARQQERAIQKQLAAARQERPVDPNKVLTLQESLAGIQVRETTPVSLTVLQQPQAEVVPAVGFQPPQSRLMRVLIAAGIGLLAGFGLALVLERFDTRIRTRQAAEEHFGAPVLAEVPVLRRRQRRGVAVARRSTAPPADAFRLLAAGVAKGASNGASNGSAVSNGGGDGRSSPSGKAILVTSPGPSDGKTTVAANLAAALGEMGRRVLLVSCDLRRPAIHRRFNVPISPGLTDLLSGDGSSSRFSPYLTGVRNVAIVPSGAVVDGSPGGMLASPAMASLLREARRVADVIVLDTSPLLVGNDATVLLGESDAVVVVARANKTRAEHAERTREVLEQLQVPVIGVALNRARETTVPGGYRHYYGVRRGGKR